MIAVLPLVLQGCALQEMLHDRISAPPAYGTALEVSTMEYLAEEKWWEQFNNDSLNILVEAALTHSPDIAQVRERLVQARAVSRQTRAAFLPSLSVTGTRGTERGDGKSPSSFALQGAASYELDIWGKNDAALTADRLQVKARVQDVRGAAVTLTASVVQDWLRVQALYEEETLLRQQVETNRAVMALQKKRYAGGIVSALDVLQQKEVLARSKSQLPDVLADRDIVKHRLAVLVGRHPSSVFDRAGHVLPALLPVPKVGIPARLLEIRPDIIAAWWRMRSAERDIKSAQRARLPVVNLTAGYTTSSAAFGDLFSTWLLNLAASAVMPVIDGGALKAEVVRQQSIANEAFHAYHSVVLSALKEVEDALSAEKHQADKIEAVEEQLEASRQALKQAQISYAGGGETYLSVLAGLVSVQNLERQILQEKRDQALNRVALYRAIGGQGWTDIVLKKNNKE